METDPAVKINVGGRTFETRTSTIVKYPDSTLACALRNGAIESMWDRDPGLFELVLDFHREGRLTRPPPEDIGVDRLVSEFRFWGFELEVPRAHDDNEPHLILGDGEVPISTFLLHLRGMGHLVHCCVLWRAIRSSGELWNAASKGYRSLSIMWSNRPTRGTPASFLRDNLAELSWLARIDGVSVQQIRSDATLDAVLDKNVMVVTGFIFPSRVTPVTDTTFVAVPNMSTTTVTFNPIAPILHPFTYRGVSYELSIDRAASVKVRTVGDRVPIQYMEDLRGALMDITLKVGPLEFDIDDFHFPTPQSGNACKLTSDVYSARGGDIDAVYALTGRETMVKLCVGDGTPTRLLTERPLVHPLILLTPPVPVSYTVFRLTW